MSSSADVRRLPSYFAVYFVVTQLLLLGTVYAFSRVDWRHVPAKKKLRWLPRP